MVIRESGADSESETPAFLKEFDAIARSSGTQDYAFVHPGLPIEQHQLETHRSVISGNPPVQ
jgi:hypothetical protein